MYMPDDIMDWLLLFFLFTMICFVWFIMMVSVLELMGVI